MTDIALRVFFIVTGLASVVFLAIAIMVPMFLRSFDAEPFHVRHLALALAASISAAFYLFRNRSEAASLSRTLAWVTLLWSAGSALFLLGLGWVLGYLLSQFD